MNGILFNPLIARVPWLPEKASALGGITDRAFRFVFASSLFVFVLMMGLMILFALAYRRRPADEPGKSPGPNAALVGAWTVLMIILAGSVFFIGLRGYLRTEIPPRNQYTIQVEARKWGWEFTYPNGYRDSELHVPYGVPVRLVMRSDDVVHSFQVPAMRLRQDLLPGRETEACFTAIEPGDYPVYCAQYCGAGYSDMTTTLVVHEPGDFPVWMKNVADPYEGMDPAEAGRMLYDEKGCAACHALDGTRRIGPSFKGVFGAEVKLRDGSRVLADAGYIEESLVDPTAKVVEGFEPVMPPFRAQLTDEEIGYIVEFIKSLGE